MPNYEEYTVRVYQNRTEWRNTKEQLHRLDGPAIEWVSGTKYWYQNGHLHRLDGPAIEWVSGIKEWYQNGKRHRLDGPAIDYANGTKEWYIDGVNYLTEEAWKERTAQLSSDDDCDGRVIVIDGKKYQLTKCI